MSTIALPACLPRSGPNLVAVLDDLNPAAATRYQRRDIDGDGHLDTFCNWLIQDFLRRMDCPLLEGRANDMIDWWADHRGRANGYLECTYDFAKRAVRRGEVIIVAWRNPAGHPGHVAAGREVDEQTNQLLIAQAGRTNFNKGTIGQGFGDLPVKLFHHR